MGLTRTKSPSRRKGRRKRGVRAQALPALTAILGPPPRRGARRPSWKLLGLAGIAGVAATGVVVARNRRAQRDVAPDELRERLHERLAQVGDAPPPPAAPPG
jgi:hypothetical protein